MAVEQLKQLNDIQKYLLEAVVEACKFIGKNPEAMPASQLLVQLMNTRSSLNELRQNAVNIIDSDINEFVFNTIAEMALINDDTITMVQSVADSFDDDFEQRQNHEETLPPTETININMVNLQYEMGRLATIVNMESIEDFKYFPELTYIVNRKHVNEIQLTDQTLSRLDCATLMANAFFAGNVPNLNFDTIKSGATGLLRQKLMCLLNYFKNICFLLNMKSDWVETRITIERYVCENRISLYNSEKPVKGSDVTVALYNPEIDYNEQNVPDAHDLIIDYVDKRLGSDTVLTDSMTYEDIMFLRFPELYAAMYFDSRDLGDCDSLCVRDVVKFNTVLGTAGAPKFVESILDTAGFVYINILALESCHLKNNVGSANSDLAYLDMSINRLQTPLIANRLSIPSTGNGGKPTLYSSFWGCPEESRPFRMLVELMTCAVADYNMVYIASDSETQFEMEDTILILNDNYTVREIYNMLTNYKFNNSIRYNVLTLNEKQSKSTSKRNRKQTSINLN
uniref:PARG catalytic Macro domain-containing protein n=1 Tax=Helicoverpa armigera nucleopolyhedrovirus TaxID=51313 RepID=A0A482EQY2_9ABAC|nr:hypothetical protein [Helicoverpa armigera nucleopolyhedrovirus]